jgi:hypothetical protein
MKLKTTAITISFILSCSSSQWWNHNMWGLPLDVLNGILVVSASLLISAILWATLIYQFRKSDAKAPASAVECRKYFVVVMWIVFPVAFAACTIIWYLGGLAYGVLQGILNM